MNHPPRRDSPEHLLLIAQARPEMLLPHQRAWLEQSRVDTREAILPFVQPAEQPAYKEAA